MSHCHHYVFSILYLSDKRKSSSEMLQVLSLFLKASYPLLSWPVLLKSHLTGRKCMYIYYCSTFAKDAPKANVKNSYFSKCILDFSCTLLVFFPTPIMLYLLLCNTHSFALCSLSENSHRNNFGVDIYTEHSKVTWVGHYHFSNTSGELRYLKHLFLYFCLLCFNFASSFSNFLSFCFSYVLCDAFFSC